MIKKRRLPRSQLLIVTLRNHPSSSIKFMSGHVRNFNQHRRDKVDALQKFQVDVHVEWHLPLFFDFFLFRGAFMMSLRKKSLSQKLLGTTSQLNIKQSIVSITDFSMSEST